jgi:hypothetical protein
MQYRNGRAVVFVQLKNIWTKVFKIAALYRRSFSAICVDEAQDMNNAQYQLLKALANGEFNHILMVGDPNPRIRNKLLCRMQYRNGRAVVFVQLKNIWTKVFDERLIHIIGR